MTRRVHTIITPPIRKYRSLLATEMFLARDLTPARNLTPRPLHVAFVQLNLIRGVESIEHFFTALPKAQLLQSAKDQ